MNKHIIPVVFLGAVLAIPAMAQQSNSGSSASGSMVQSDREPLQAPRASDFWDGDDPNVVNLITHPFANKKYVLRHTQPIKDRLNELDEITSENSRSIKDIDSRSQQGIQMASEKSSVADQHATDAMNKAQVASSAANQASTRVGTTEQMVNGLDQYKGTAQTEIRFRPGQSVLSKSAKDALDSMAGQLKDQRGYIIEVQGFAGGHGQGAIANSRKMADSVVRYLVLTHGIPVYRIYALSMGSAAPEASGAKHVTGGRVEVNVLQNGVVNTAQK